jgi:hypothetical protein
VSLLFVRFIDTYYSLRVIGANSFDYVPWRLQFSALFQSYPYQKIKFIFEAQDEVSYESRAYLGAAILFSLVGAAIAAIIYPAAAKRLWQQWRTTWQFKFLMLFLAASVLGLFASMGTNYLLFDDKYVYRNYLSVLFYLSKITKMTGHFRAVARMVWPFFWAVNLLVLVGFDYWLHTSRSWLRWLALAGIAVLFTIDAKDAIKWYRTNLNPNVLSAEQMAPIAELASRIDPYTYQAILPMPYFHTGTEGVELTVDDDNDFSTRAFQLAMQTGLPLLSAKLGRTSPVQTQALFTMFDPGGPEPALRAQLSQKPVLVFIDQSYYDGSRDFLARQTWDAAKRVVGAGATFAQDHQLTLVSEMGTFRLYRWDVPAVAPVK